MCPRVGAHQRKNTPSGVFFSVIQFLYWLISSLFLKIRLFYTGFFSLFFKIRLVLFNKSKGFAGDFYDGILRGTLVSEFSSNPEFL